MVYQRKKINAQFLEIDYFSLDDDRRYGWNYFNVYIKQCSGGRSALGLKATLTEKSFVIENQPAGSMRNCRETDLVDLKPYSCFGDIQIRKLSSDD